MEWLKTLYRWFFLDVKEDSQGKSNLSAQAKDNRESLKAKCKDSIELTSEQVFKKVHKDILESVQSGDTNSITFIGDFNKRIHGMELRNIKLEVIEKLLLNKLHELYSDRFTVKLVLHLV